MPKNNADGQQTRGQESHAAPVVNKLITELIEVVTSDEYKEEIVGTAEQNGYDRIANEVLTTIISQFLILESLTTLRNKYEPTGKWVSAADATKPESTGFQQTG